MSTNEEDRKRLLELERELQELRTRQEAGNKPGSTNPHARASQLVMRLLTDLGAGLAAGVLMGWGIDKWLETAPWGIIVGSLLGLAAGVRNVLHTADSVAARTPRDPQAEP